MAYSLAANDMAMATCSAFLLAMFVMQFNPVAGAAFLAQGQNNAMSLEPKLEGAFFAEVEEAFGNERRVANENSLSDIEEALEPTFNSLSKNEHGNLAPAALRYALHRLFVQRHGWYVKGVFPSSDTWTSSSHVDILEQASNQTRGIVSTLLQGNGFSLRDAAVLASVIEHQVFKEATMQLQSAYVLHGLSAEHDVSADQRESLLEMMMISYIWGTDLSTLTADQAEFQKKSITEIYPNWPETKKFLQDIQMKSHGSGHFTFQEVARIMEQMQEQYLHHQEFECTELRQKLNNLEDEGTGRVALSVFYRSALHDGQWQFSESSEYLRQIGALDESNPRRPSVIISNYVSGISNCMASSNYFSLCCMNPCDDLMDHLEKQFNAPSVTPNKIVAAVAALGSQTVIANRNLPTILVQRLHEIAATHGGQVPLHGRLFAQWMHHAYPRECPYPHISGTTLPRTPEVYESESGMATTASEEEMQQHTRSESRRKVMQEGDEAGECSPWTTEEELLVPLQASSSIKVPQQRSSVSNIIRGLAYVSVLISALLVALHKIISTAVATGMHSTKHYV